MPFTVFGYCMIFLHEIRKNAEYKKLQYANTKRLFIYIAYPAFEAIVTVGFRHSSSKPNVTLGTYSLHQLMPETEQSRGRCPR